MIRRCRALSKMESTFNQAGVIRSAVEPCMTDERSLVEASNQLIIGRNCLEAGVVRCVKKPGGQVRRLNIPALQNRRHHMKNRILLTLLLFSLSLIAFNNIMAQDVNSSMMLQPPTTEKKPKITDINGDRMVDNYFWLREKSNPSVIAHLEAENAYGAAMMKPTEAMQDKLYNEILSHIKQTDVSVPYRWGDYFYYTRTKEGQQYPIYCRKQGSVDAPEQILLDLNEMAKGQKFMAIGSFAPSDDGNTLAYST